VGTVLLYHNIIGNLGKTILSGDIILLIIINYTTWVIKLTADVNKYSNLAFVAK